MKIYNPTKVFFEESAVEKYLRDITYSNVLIITDGQSSRMNHSLDDVLDALNGKNISLYDGVESNPSIDTIKKIADLFKDNNIEICIGIGGGSSIDAAKAASILLCYSKNVDIEDLFFCERNAKHLPIIAIPTTCGTGSEVTPFSVLTDDSLGTKRTIFSQLYPEMALIDKKYIKTLPYKVCVSTAVDALAHLIEACLSSRANDYNRYFSFEGLKLFSCVKDYLTNERTYSDINDGIREKMMAIAMFGGYAIAANGSSIPHGLANTITHEMNIPHGKSVIIFIPGYLKNYRNQDIITKIVKLIGFNSVDELEDYLYSILGSVILSKQLWNSEIDKMMSNNHKLSSYPFEMTRDVLKKYPSKLLIIE